MFEILFEKFNKFYESIFYSYGKFLSKYYVYLIVASLVVNSILSFGLLRLNLLTDSDDLYSLIDSKARRTEADLKKLFNTTYTNEKKYFIHQLLDLGTWAELNFHVNPGHNDTNILSPLYFDEILSIHNGILENVKVKSLVDSNVTLDYTDMCARRFDRCAIDGESLLQQEDFFGYLKKNSIKLLNEKNANVTNKKMNSDDRLFDSNMVYIDSQMSLTDLRYNLGKGFRYLLNNDSHANGVYAYASLLKIRYSLKSNYENMDATVKRWEVEFLNYIKTVQTNSTNFTYATSQSLEIEMLDNIGFDAYLMSGTFILITIFAVLLMSLKSNWVTSPGLLLPCAGILSATFGCMTAMGLIAFCNYPACNLVFVIPFLVLGIGIDDMFIIYSSFQHTNSEWTTEERVAMALKKSGVSITITSLTDFVAFIVGVSTNFKSVQIFCIYAAFSILFCYVYQLTFFGGFLVIHSNRIKSKRNCVIWCLKHDTDDKKQVELDNMKKQRQPVTDDDLEKVYNETTVCLETNGDGTVFFGKFRQNWLKFYKFIIYKRIGKCMAGILFLLYITVSLYNAVQIEEGMDMGDLVAHKSHFRSYIQDNINSLDMAPVVMLVIHEPVDYTNRRVRSQIDALLKAAQSIPGIKRDFSLNWLDRFDVKLHEYRRTGYNDEILDDIVNDITPFSNDIVLRVNTTSGKRIIYASRFYVQYEKLHFNSLDAKPMNDLRELCAQSHLPIVPYAVTFKFYEQFEQTLPNVIQTFVIAGEAMYVISLIFVPDIITALCIIASMVSIMLGLIGFMHIWGLTLSSITMLQLLMSVGFCVDFSAHLTHAFIANVGPGTRSERAFKACMHTGLPIFNSALSTIIGVCILAFCQSYIFVSFFKTMFILMCLGVLNSMLFLPVLLALIGPNWSRHRIVENNKTKDETGCNGENENFLVEKVSK